MLSLSFVHPILSAQPESAGLIAIWQGDFLPETALIVVGLSASLSLCFSLYKKAVRLNAVENEVVLLAQSILRSRVVQHRHPAQHLSPLCLFLRHQITTTVFYSRNPVLDELLTDRQSMTGADRRQLVSAKIL